MPNSCRSADGCWQLSAAAPVALHITSSLFPRNAAGALHASEALPMINLIH